MPAALKYSPQPPPVDVIEAKTESEPELPLLPPAEGAVPPSPIVTV